MGKRYRRPKAKDGELKVQYGKSPNDEPDICFVWGPGIPNQDCRLIGNLLTRKNPHHDERSFLEELEHRGYDIKTLKFSVFKKNVD